MNTSIGRTLSRVLLLCLSVVPFPLLRAAPLPDASGLERLRAAMEEDFHSSWEVPYGEMMRRTALRADRSGVVVLRLSLVPRHRND